MQVVNGGQKTYNIRMNSKKIYTMIGLILIAALVIFILVGMSKTPVSTGGTPAPTADNMGLEDGNTPWPAEFARLRLRLATIGLPALSAEGTVLHIHQHLDIQVNGTAVPVPAGIGIDPQNQFISPIHVHDTTGIIHVESPTVETFTLGQLFDIWGLKVTGDCIGGYCTNGQASLQMYVNGTLYQGNPRDLVLAAHQEIFLFYGTPDQLPKAIPSTYTFPEGY